jgi:hypothetical protein
MKTLFFCFLLCAMVAHAAPRPSAMGRLVFPDDPSVINAKRDLGAKGDGVTDDTAALQRGIDQSSGLEARQSKVLFLPNGTYRVRNTLVVKNALGPWLYGESRDGVIIKLDDNIRETNKEINAVIRTHPNEKGPTSADWFMRNLRNFTIDVGNNPEVDGIRYYATNTGMLKNVRVIGRGKVGINAGFLDQSGPNLIQDCEVDGFETGIQSQWIWGETLSRVTIRNCRKQGLYVSANSVAVEDLVVENTPIAVVCDIPNDWYWWGGVVSIVGARFSGGDPNGPAIVNKNVLYARDVQTKGFQMALQSGTPGGNVTAQNIGEYLSHPPRKAFDSPAASLQLPIESEPAFAWESDPKNWLCANDFGAVAGDNKDDTAAIQKALDEAAAQKKSVVYFRGCGGGDPNWYNLDGEVKVQGSVRYVLGLGWARILGGENGRFVVDDKSAPIVKFQNIDSFGGPPAALENRSKNRTMLVESCGVTIVGDGGGDIFAIDCPARVDLRRSGQKMWARHLNPEGNDDIGLVRNNGAALWVLGVKCEGQGVRFLTKNKGRTEIFGAFMYSANPTNTDQRPLFDVDNASFTMAGIREISFAHTFPIKLREKRGEETKTLAAGQEHGWIGWSLISAWTK